MAGFLGASAVREDGDEMRVGEEIKTQPAQSEATRQAIARYERDQRLRVLRDRQAAKIPRRRAR